MITVDKIEKKFAFVLAAAKRARQLQGGAKPLVRGGGRKHTSTAMEEVLAGEVPFDLPVVEDEEEEDEKTLKRKRRSKS